MAETFQSILRDMPIVDPPGRPEGMLAYMRSEVPDEFKPAVDAWVEEKGGDVVPVPLIKVHGGTTPESGPESDGYYWLPPAALVDDAE
jgi:hypothetical protein